MPNTMNHPNAYIPEPISETDGSVSSVLSSSADGLRLPPYFHWLTETIQKNRANPVFQDSLLPIIREEAPYAGSVFLSVVMRTQGRRPEALREALLCMYAQSCRDFEVILIAHKPEPDQLTLVEEILDELEPEFRKKVRFFVLRFGQRSMPLNIGFAHARGEYIAVLDDDDLVLEDWVQEFRNASQLHSGKLLHAYAFSQRWRSIDSPEAAGGLRASGAPLPQFCESFFMAHQLLSNFCPLNSLAFPRSAFIDCAIIFNDELTTTEDWDCFMRTAFLFGVSDIDRPTSIYRLWDNSENSYSVHSRREWKDNRRKILNGFMDSYVLLQPEDVKLMIMEHYSPESEDVDDDNNKPDATPNDEPNDEPDDTPTITEVLRSSSWKIGRTITFLSRQLVIFSNIKSKDGLKAAFRFLKEKIRSIPTLYSRYYKQ